MPNGKVARMAAFNTAVRLIPVIYRASSDGPSAIFRVCAIIPVVRKHNATAIVTTSIFRGSFHDHRRPGSSCHRHQPQHRKAIVEEFLHSGASKVYAAARDRESLNPFLSLLRERVVPLEVESRRI